ncbi:MAG TPA: hypothetical protein VNT30_02450 [Stellaceae bacterium]|nr:hypothetical protein [Stellaceae bacterium]
MKCVVEALSSIRRNPISVATAGQNEPIIEVCPKRTYLRVPGALVMLDDRRNDHDEEEHRVTTSLAGLAFVLLLVVIGLYLEKQLGTVSALQDCVLSGRTNCFEITVPVP